MKLSRTAVCLCWIAILLAPEVMGQQANAPSQSWDVLLQLPAGEKLMIERKDGKKFRGAPVTISDTELLIKHKGRTFSFKRDEVRQVWQVTPPSLTKQRIFSGIGAGAGFMAGLAIAVSLGFKQCGGSCTDEKIGILAAVIGLPVGGALAGKALAGNGNRRLIYSAP